MQQLSRDLEKQREINKTLIDGIESGEDVIIAEIGQPHLQYCKKVKYLDKAWILVVKEGEYYWVDLEKVPLEIAKKINVEKVEENEAKLEEMLNEMIHEKNQLEKMMVVTNRRREHMLLNDPKDKKIESLNAKIEEYQFKNKDLAT